MESSLLALLKDTRVSAEAIDFLKTKDLVSINDFAGAVDTALEIETKLLRQAEAELRENVAVVSRLKNGLAQRLCRHG